MFSVVIPVYNSENTIEIVLDSVLNQTRYDLIEEIIIVNDGSTDKSGDIIKKYQFEHINSKIKYYYNKNHGVSYTRNFGINNASGEWIALLDSDDIWLPMKIEKQAIQIWNNPNILFLGTEYPLKIGMRNFKSGLYKLTAKQLCIRSCPVTPSVVFMKKVGEELGLFNENMKYSEDINFFQKFLQKDSYYILAEDLVRIGIDKKYHACSGLSSNIKKMHEGRNQNALELYEKKLIGKVFLFFILKFNSVKYCRRIIINKLNQLIFER